MQPFKSDSNRIENYQIVLKNVKIRSYRFIALLLVFLNFSVFILLLVSDVRFFESAAALFLISIYLPYRFYLHKKYKTSFFMDEVSFFILAGSWIGLQSYLFAAACVFVGILYHLALQKLLFIFTSEDIKKMNFPKAEYPWSIFSNVILKDNILTLDFKNNKLIQAEIEDNLIINEKEFNEFATRQLYKHRNSQETISLK